MRHSGHIPNVWGYYSPNIDGAARIYYRRHRT